MARSRLRQLIPTKFATAYRTNHGDGTDPHTPEFCTWWMWLGRCYRIHRTTI